MQENISTANSEANYSPDVLGDGFEQRVLALAKDYEGKVVATLVRKKSLVPSTRAILYIHGFNDYFFQAHVANRFSKEGLNFYALDLRKYGRSLLTHQKLNNVRSLLEYDEEINIALQIIKSEMNTQVILMGHSTGGLVITNYAGRHLSSSLFHGIICNSPFYEFNLSFIERKIGIPVLSFLGGYFPNILVSSEFSKLYGYSINSNKYGEWNYSVAWKPHDIPKINLGFIHAIKVAQKNVQRNLHLTVPTLILRSSKSIYEKTWSDKLMTGDAVLNVKHIRYYGGKIGGNVTPCEIENGIHDLFLSKKTTREMVFEKVLTWMKVNFALPPLP